MDGPPAISACKLDNCLHYVCIVRFGSAEPGSVFSSGGLRTNRCNEARSRLLGCRTPVDSCHLIASDAQAVPANLLERRVVPRDKSVSLQARLRAAATLMVAALVTVLILHRAGLPFAPGGDGLASVSDSTWSWPVGFASCI
jgi:hypothetical protein